jgi:DNA-binding transcriptional LysR family regulator
MKQYSSMKRGLFDEFAAFAAVVEERSFRRAASRLGVTPSAVSHAVRQLEERLATRLLNRTTRSVSLTERGEQLLEELRPAFRHIEETLGSLDLDRQQPTGRLRIYTTHLASRAVIAPVWREYRTLFPEVRMEIEVGEASIEFTREGFDAAIWSRNRAPLDMIAVKMTDPMKVAVVGSPCYFSVRAQPEMPPDLSRHDCVEYRRNPDEASIPWHFERKGKSQKVPVKGALVVNNHELNLRAALDGLGIAYSLEALAGEALQRGRLVRVLEPWCPVVDGLYLYHPSRRQMLPALRAFIDLVGARRDETGKGM